MCSLTPSSWDSWLLLDYKFNELGSAENVGTGWVFCCALRKKGQQRICIDLPVFDKEQKCDLVHEASIAMERFFLRHSE